MIDGAVVCQFCGQAQEAPAMDALPIPVPEIPPAPASSQLHSETPLFSAADSSADRELTGIGGWLILLAINITLAPLMGIPFTYASLHVLFGGQFQDAIAARPGLEPLIIFEAATNVLFLAALIGLNVLFYRKKKAFPIFMVTYIGVHALLIAIDHFSALRFYPLASSTALVRTFISLAWIPYLLTSRRVQLTFVN